MRWIAPILAVLCGVGFLAQAAENPDADKPKKPSAEASIDYVKQIKPILTKHCNGCHNADKLQSGFRLDVGALAIRGGDRGAAIIPGQSKKSLLIQALVGEGDVERMPLEKEPLPKETIALIARWIDQGAKLPESEKLAGKSVRRTSDHWAFKKIQRPPLPQTKTADWIRNPIDAFVLARLEQEGLAPSGEADKSTLIRRLSLDLRGVPPTPAELQRFLDDRRPDAYVQLVDRFLASPQYGERWGRHWLDAARYADSNGFTIDGPRSIWKYRDWVIDAINRDLPFDQYSIEQLAGDLLPNATPDQITATGFHRNTLINQEGGTDDEQFRVEGVVDRVNTTGAVFLGLTIGCAQCHEHKYDPFTQRDFYQVYAFFNNTEDINTANPTIALPSPRQSKLQQRIAAQLKEVEDALKKHDEALAQQQPAWEKAALAAKPPAWTVLQPAEFTSAQRATINKKDDQSLIVGGNGNIPAKDTYIITADLRAPRLTAVRLEALTDKGLPNDGPGLAESGKFVLSEFSLEARPLGADGKPAGDPQTVKFSAAICDWAERGFPPAQTIDGDTGTGWSIGVGKQDGPLNAPREVFFIAGKPLENEHGWRLTFKLVQNHSVAKHQIGRLRLSAGSEEVNEAWVAESIRKQLAVASDKRDAVQRRHLTAAHRRSDQSRGPLQKRLAALTKESSQLKAKIPTTMVLKERKKRRVTNIQIRGDFLRRGAVVEPDSPGVLPPIEAEPEDRTRLDFARWLFRADNPLTARVTVNRFWQRFFGLGLVETENDFGLQGEPPTHPRLLDWLAAEFMQGGWGVKRLHRLIVTSSAYRQSSAFRGELLERDPRNRLIARQSRLRLEGEAIRDCCLQASGLLSDRIGGPGVYPPQPTGIHVLTQVTKQWPEEKGGDRYRRGMYTFFWRSNPYPFLATFDAPSSTTTCTRRTRSNTPLQSLTLANDSVFVELAQTLAERILRNGGDDDRQRIRYAVRVCLSREASDFELSRLAHYVSSQRNHYEQKLDAARKIAPRRLGKTERAAEGAAWTGVARVLMNLDEFVTRE